MPIVPFGEWLPDQPAGAGSNCTRNVIARTARSYGPMASPMPVTVPLPDRAMGNQTLFSADRRVFSYTATRAALWQFAGSTIAAWVNVSKAGGYGTLSFEEGGTWDSCTFGNRVIFTNYIDPVQSLLIGAGGAVFADLSAAAPKARYCTTIRDFLFLGATNDPVDGEQPRRLWWSSIGDPTDWPVPGSDLAIQRQSDFQDLEQSELGHLRGIVGGNLSGADGAAFMERGIVRITYAGSPAIFDFVVAEGASGTASPWSIVPRRIATPAGVRAVAYYYGDDGFLAFDGASATSIGAQKFDRFVYEDLVAARRGQVLGASVPYAHLLLWAYHGAGTTTDLYNRLLVYNWELQKATLVELEPFEWIEDNISSGLSLDDLDPFGSLETLSHTLDSDFWRSSKPSVGVFDSTHRFNTFTGPPLAPTVETVESGLPGRRSKLHGTVRPIIEGVGGNAALVEVGHRERQMDSVVYDAQVPVNLLGTCGVRSTGRYVRLRLKLPARSDFNHLIGVEVDLQPEGRLR